MQRWIYSGMCHIPFRFFFKKQCILSVSRKLYGFALYRIPSALGVHPLSIERIPYVFLRYTSVLIYFNNSKFAIIVLRLNDNAHHEKF